MILRATQFAAFLVVLSAVLAAPKAALANYCGPGCHASPSGACVRDGWDQGMRVRNECPAYAAPRPPCGDWRMRWDRRKVACFPN